MCPCVEEDGGGKSATGGGWSTHALGAPPVRLVFRYRLASGSGMKMTNTNQRETMGCRGRPWGASAGKATGVRVAAMREAVGRVADVLSSRRLSTQRRGDVRRATCETDPASSGCVWRGC